MSHRMRNSPRQVLVLCALMVSLFAIGPRIVAANLVPNGDFESGANKWRSWPHDASFFSVQPATGREGAAALLDATKANKAATAYTYARLNGRHIYALSYWYKTAMMKPTSAAEARLRIYFNAKNKGNGSAGQLSVDIPMTPAPEAWRRRELIFIAPPDAVTAQLAFKFQAARGRLWLDDVTLRDLASPVIHRTTSAPSIDGQLDDAVWQRAEPLRGFWDIDRRSSLADTGTTAYLAYDDQNLYVAFRNAEPYLDQRLGDISKRDGQVWTDDCIEVFVVGPEGEGVHLLVSCRNVQADLRLQRNSAEDVRWNQTWDGRWKSATASGEDAWFVELRIPFSTLNFSPRPGTTWKVNLARERHVGLREVMQWNRAPGGFGTVAHFASLKFDRGQAELERFVADTSVNPLAIARPDAAFETLLGDQRGRYAVGSWGDGGLYLSKYPRSIKQKHTEQSWHAHARAMMQQRGEVGMYGPKFPWAPKHLGWDLLESINESYGTEYPLSIYNSALSQRARERGAKWFVPNGRGGGRVAIITPELIQVIKEFARDYVNSDPRVREMLYGIDAIDEPSNGIVATFSPTRRPEMKEALVQLDHTIRTDFGYGKYGLYDKWAPQDDQTPFERIAFWRWWNHRLAQAMDDLDNFFDELTPDVQFAGFDVNATSSMNSVDAFLVSRSTDALCTDPYPTKTLALYGRARALYHIGFTTKLLKDITGKPLRVIPQGFVYYGRGPTAADAREWASQAIKNGASGLRWYMAGPAAVTISETYEEILRINDVVSEMNHLTLPQETNTAIFFSQVNRWGQSDKPMHAPYTLYVLLGERLGSWFNFVSDTQLARDASALDAYELIYVPQLEYVDRTVAQRLIDRAKAGATLVIFDPEAFTWAPDGTHLTQLRREARGTGLAHPRSASRLILTDKAKVAAGTALPLSPIADREGAGKVQAYTFAELPEHARVIAAYDDGEPAAYEVSLGEGSVIWFAAQPFGNSRLVVDQSDWERWLRTLAERVGEQTDRPLWQFLIPPAAASP